MGSKVGDPELVSILKEIQDIGEAGVISRSETGKTAWWALDEVARLSGRALVLVQKQNELKKGED